MPELILTAELVPSTSWYNNLRNVIAREDWDWIRSQVYLQYENRCGICGAGGSLHCHEVWHYDDVAHLQALEGFIALCPWCHHIKHLGYAGILAQQGKLDYAKLIGEKRSRYKWRVELGEYTSIIKASPAVK